MGNIVALLIALVGLGSRKLLGAVAVAWQSPFGWLVPLSAALIVWLAPQMPDMIAGLLDDDRQRTRMAGFALGTVFLGLSGWHWMRAEIAARWGVQSSEDLRRRVERAAPAEIAAMIGSAAVAPPGAPPRGPEAWRSDAAVARRAVETAPRTAITMAGLLAVAVVLACSLRDAEGAGAAIRAEEWAKILVVLSAMLLAALTDTETARAWMRRRGVPTLGLLALAGCLLMLAGVWGLSRGTATLGWPEVGILVMALVGGRLVPIGRRALINRFSGRFTGGVTIVPWPPANRLRCWARGVPHHLVQVVCAAPFGWFVGSALLLAAPAWMLLVAFAPERLPPAPTTTVVSLALLVGPLTLLHAAFARLPTPAPNTAAFVVVFGLIFVLPWNPPSLYAMRMGAALHADQRSELETALTAWRKTCLGNEEAGGPAIIVAAEGGASRGALWMLSAMRALDDSSDGAFGRHLFAISAVSGGSLGAATYLAARRAAPAGTACGLPRGALDEPIRRLGGTDLLAPIMGTYFLADTLRRIVPLGPLLTTDWLPDRGAALEAGFERLWRGAAPSAATPMLIGPSGTTATPHLLLNGTDVEAGRRVIASTLRFGPHDAVRTKTGDLLFADADDLLGTLGRDVPLATAVTVSARFPFISPAGRFVATEPDNGPFGWLRTHWCRLGEFLARRSDSGACEAGRDRRQVVDGGYFENYGALTALELARKVERLTDGAVRPIIVLITNDLEHDHNGPATDLLTCALPEAKPAAQRMASKSRQAGDPAAQSELLAPMFGLYATRAAHGLAAQHALRRELCRPNDARLVHLALPRPRREREEAAPMNWVLNAAARRLMLESAFTDAHNAAQMRALCGLLGRPNCEPPAGPVTASR